MSNKLDKKETYYCNPDGYKYVSSSFIQEEYGKLSLAKKNEILYEAIDIMQQYNSRSRFYCIARAMGYKNDEGYDSTYYKKS